MVCPLQRWRWEKNERIPTQKRGSVNGIKITGTRKIHKINLHADHVGVDGFASSVLCVWHMQSGQGKVYMESFGLLSSKPFESL